MKTALKLIGPQLKRVMLGDCRKNTLVFGFDQYQYHSYTITGTFDPEEFIAMLSETCTNIEELQVDKSYVKKQKLYEQLLQSTTKLKKVILPDANLLMLPNCTYNSVEGITLNVLGKSNFENFDLVCVNVLLHSFLFFICLRFLHYSYSFFYYSYFPMWKLCLCTWRHSELKNSWTRF